jgi:acetyl-CoA carboxylase biotin carboxyl carrier protein
VAEPSDNPRPFDVQTIRYLVRLMASNDVSELDLAEGDRKIRIRRDPRLVPGVPAAPLASLAPVAMPPSAQAAPVEKAAPAAPAKKLLEIKSQAVGTFYSRRDPSSPPLVALGTKVTPTTVVCIIEAMKVFNEIPAECTGTIVELCLQDKDFVEYGTVLFRVDPAG